MSVHSQDGGNTLNPAFESLSEKQKELISLPFSGTVYLEGIVGSGKTTAAVARWRPCWRPEFRANPSSFLSSTTLADPYLHMLHQSKRPAGGEAEVMTLGGLARRMVQLYWPMIAEEAGFIHPELTPGFSYARTCSVLHGADRWTCAGCRPGDVYLAHDSSEPSLQPDSG